MMIQPGDTVHPIPYWNETTGAQSHKLPHACVVQAVIRPCNSQSGEMYTVVTLGGHLIQLDAAWFEEGN